MAAIFPPGNDPLVFSATLPAGSTDTAKAPLGGQQASPFTTTAPSGSMSLAFLIFAYPNGNSDPGGNPLPPPQTPLVEVRTGGGPWQMLQGTAGTGGAPLSLGDPADKLILDYTMAAPDANGVVQIAFQRNNAPFDRLAWDIRFTINDGVTSAAAQTGLTFVVDAADARAPWLAVPGQPTLSPTGPAPIDLAAALTSITLAGPADAGSADQLDPGQTYTVLLPVGNYGADPLTISSVSPTDMTNGFSIRLLTSPLKIAPGGIDKVTLQATFQAPADGESEAPTAFTLVCNDPLAAGSGATAHFNVVSLFAHVRQHDAWVTEQSIPTARQGLGLAAAGDGKLYAVGGNVTGSDSLSTVEEYDPAENTWATNKAPMPSARTGIGLATASNGKLYAVGGAVILPDGNPEKLNAVEEYDPAENRWATNKAPMPTPRTLLGLATAGNGKLYAVGGFGANLAQLSTVEEYDPDKDSWKTKKPMLTPRWAFGLATASNGKLYAVGGLSLNDPFTAMKTVEEYDPEHDLWTPKAPLLTPRFALGLAAASNGKLYAVGGQTFDGPGLPTVEEYDPARDTWTPKAAMTTPRKQLGFASSRDGNLYAVGGLVGDEPPPSPAVEAYTP